MSLVRFRVISVDDSGPIQKVTGRGEGGERLENLMRPQPDGLTTVPEVGSLGWAQFAGSRERGIVAGLENPDKRPSDQPGGSKILYGPDGQKLNLKPGGAISLEGGDGQTFGMKANGDQVLKPKAAGGKVYLGGDPADGGVFARVMTEAGASPFVFAKVS
ncbi:phage baseplate assembly protein [Bosea sp. (in: a-proteobacteria)]|uniref:phage baseplate assembly protein domain-containing protein n=1 Tax=Bosea sp. (in: a-proteobacteria) TaxID=1871050 RepID=UPI002735107F|nr:phage baseplate assembly protein [Bosea sp. (in: a-proteobacteria)]MDP3407230.1 phage baseplate assembly protein [Bosea sp. (in: a-proteobacteria)]